MIADNFQSSISSQSAQTSDRSHAPSLLDAFGTFLGRLLIDQLESFEPTVTQKRDRHGNLCWYIYNPATGETNVFTSEQDARAYLENRHHVIPE